MVERNGKLVRSKRETTFVAGIPLVSTVTEEFDFRTYPENVRRSLIKSNIPQQLYPDALAVVGRAYGNVLTNWSSERVGETADLTWKVPAPDDFDSCVENLRQVGVDALLGLSDKLFGTADTPPEIFMSMQNELDLIFNPPDKKDR